jgi:hypothetical protein
MGLCGKNIAHQFTANPNQTLCVLIFNILVLIPAMFSWGKFLFQLQNSWNGGTFSFEHCKRDTAVKQFVLRVVGVEPQALPTAGDPKSASRSKLIWLVILTTLKNMKVNGKDDILFFGK